MSENLAPLFQRLRILDFVSLSSDMLLYNGELTSPEDSPPPPHPSLPILNGVGKKLDY